jgi:chromosome segregation ATPase
MAPHVHRAAAQLLSTSDMVAQLNQTYENTSKNMITVDAPPQLQALEKIAATQLDGQLFRSELQKLSGDLAFAETQAASASRSLQALTGEYEGRGAWIATLTEQLAAAQAEILRIEAARASEHGAQEQYAAQLQAEIAAREAYAAKLQRDVTDTLALAQRQERTLSLIPRFLRRWMLWLADRLVALKASR